MKKFWIVAVANMCNMLSERYYTYEDAVEAAEEKSKLSPGNIFLVLELCGYAEGSMSVNVEYSGSKDNSITAFKDTSFKLKMVFKDENKMPLDLTNCKVQFIILPHMYLSDDEAIYSEIKTWTDPSIESYPSDGFYGNSVDFLIPVSATENVGLYTYQVRIIYNTEPTETVTYIDDKFIVE